MKITRQITHSSDDLMRDKHLTFPLACPPSIPHEVQVGTCQGNFGGFGLEGWKAHGDRCCLFTCYRLVALMLWQHHGGAFDASMYLSIGSPPCKHRNTRLIAEYELKSIISDK